MKKFFRSFFILSLVVALFYGKGDAVHTSADRSSDESQKSRPLFTQDLAFQGDFICVAPLVLQSYDTLKHHIESQGAVIQPLPVDGDEQTSSSEVRFFTVYPASSEDSPDVGTSARRPRLYIFFRPEFSLAFGEDLESFSTLPVLKNQIDVSTVEKLAAHSTASVSLPSVPLSLPNSLSSSPADSSDGVSHEFVPSSSNRSTPASQIFSYLYERIDFEEGKLLRIPREAIQQTALTGVFRGIKRDVLCADAGWLSRLVTSAPFSTHPRRHLSSTVTTYLREKEGASEATLLEVWHFLNGSEIKAYIQGLNPTIPYPRLLSEMILPYPEELIPGYPSRHVSAPRGEDMRRYALLALLYPPALGYLTSYIRRLESVLDGQLENPIEIRFKTSEDRIRFSDNTRLLDRYLQTLREWKGILTARRHQLRQREDLDPISAIVLHKEDTAIYDTLVEQDPYVGHWLRSGFTKNKAKAIEDCKASIKLGNAMGYIELGRRSFYNVLDGAAFYLNAGLKGVPSGWVELGAHIASHSDDPIILYITGQPSSFNPEAYQDSLAAEVLDIPPAQVGPWVLRILRDSLQELQIPPHLKALINGETIGLSPQKQLSPSNQMVALCYCKAALNHWPVALEKLDRFFLGDDFRTKRFYLKQEPQKEVFEWMVQEGELTGYQGLMRWDPKYGEQLDLYGALIMNGGDTQHSLAYQEALNRLGSDLAKLQELYQFSSGQSYTLSPEE